MLKITPFLWFDTEAEEAARLYCSIFPNSRIGQVSRYGPAGPGPEGSVMTVAFELDGLSVTALNGGPNYRFNEAVSFSVSCDDQAEVDRYWTALTSNGGEEGRCAWCKDRFGFSWQVVPKALPELLSLPDRGKATRAMQAMMGMKKIDIAALRAAAEAG